VVPSLPRETPLKQEKSCSTSLDWQSGQQIPFSEAAPIASPDIYIQKSAWLLLSFLPDALMVAQRLTRVIISQ